MNGILFDGRLHKSMLPLTFTRPAAELRIGILNARERWEKVMGISFSYATQEYLSDKYPIRLEEDNLFIHPLSKPDEVWLKALSSLAKGEALVQEGVVLAFRLDVKMGESLSRGLSDQNDLTELLNELNITWIQKEGVTLWGAYPWDLFRNNGDAIEFDFELLTKGRESARPGEGNTIIGNPDLVFLEEGAELNASIINTKNGPVYLGKGSEIMEGSVVRGPLALCDYGVLKLSTKIYGPTTVGPFSKVGGELNNSVIMAYSNKGHDGFLGNSVVGEWCNLGADTNNSNLKNNYGEVRVWSYETGEEMNTGLQFCGLIMGDYSKCGINTMFNTGTIVGVNANVFGAGFPNKFVPSYSWGGADKMVEYQFDKALDVAQKVCERRKVILTTEDKEILKNVMDMTEKYRQ